MTGPGRRIVIGIGNRNRGDDAIGPAIVDELRARGTTLAASVVEGDVLDLLLRWGPDDDVVIVDAITSGRPPGTVVIIDALSATLPISSEVSSHGIGVGEAVELAKLLDRTPRALSIVGIEIRDCDPGDRLTNPVTDAIPPAADAVEALLPHRDGLVR